MSWKVRKKMIKEAILQDINKGKTSVIIYLILGYPDFETSIKALDVLKKHNVTVYETAIPIVGRHSPELSEMIKMAHRIAYQNGTSSKDVVETFSIHRPNLYIIHEGTPSYILDFLVANKEMIDGILWGCDEEDEYYAKFRESPIEVIQEVSPESSRMAIKKSVEIANGFIYLTVAERTGGEIYSNDKIIRTIDLIREFGDNIPICFGFGIKTPEDISRLVNIYGCDGIIIGTAGLKALSMGLKEFDSYIETVFATVRNQ